MELYSYDAGLCIRLKTKEKTLESFNFPQICTLLFNFHLINNVKLASNFKRLR